MNCRKKLCVSFGFGEQRFIHQERTLPEGPKAPEVPQAQPQPDKAPEAKAREVVESCLDRLACASELQGEYEKTYWEFRIKLASLSGTIQNIWESGKKVDVDFFGSAIRDFFHEAGIPEAAPSLQNIKISFQALGPGDLEGLMARYRERAKNALLKKQHEDARLARKYKIIYERALALLRPIEREGDPARRERLAQTLYGLARKNWGLSSPEIAAITSPMMRSSFGPSGQAEAFAYAALQKDTPFGGLNGDQARRAKEVYLATR